MNHTAQKTSGIQMESSPLPLPPETKAPYVLAITGHRDIRKDDESLDQLTRAVRQILESIRSRMKNTPIILLTGLAEGADQLVADIALQLHFYVAAVIPKKLEEYLAPMSPESRESFNRLYQKCCMKIHINHEQHSIAPRPDKDEAFVNLGKYLIAHSHAVIALWDGVPHEKPGGTSDVVQMALKEESSASNFGSTLIYHLFTPREGGSTLEEAYKLRLLGTQLSNTESEGSGELFEVIDPTDADQIKRYINTTPFAETESRIDAFNAQVLQIDSKNRTAVSRDSRKLLPAGEMAQLSPFARRLHALYLHADQLSIHHKLYTSWFAAAGITLIALATLLVKLPKFWPPQELVLKISSFLLLLLYNTWFLNKAHLKEDSYLEYRALAESLRVQFFWLLSGVREIKTCSHLCLCNLRNEWMSSTFRVLWIFKDEAKSASYPEIGQEGIVKNWIQNQSNWYLLKSAAYEVKVRRKNGLILASQIAMIPSGLSIAGELYNHWHHLAGSPNIALFLQFAFAIPAIFLLAVDLWIAQSDLTEQMHEYKRIGYYLQRQARLAFKRIANMEEVQDNNTEFIREEVRQIMRDTGLQALEENARWLLHHRKKAPPFTSL